MFLKILLLFIVTPLIEMAILIELGGRFGTWHTIGIVLLTGFIGASLAKAQGLQVYRNLTRSLYNGELPHNHLIEGLLLFVGGALLITPGVLTDILGIVLILPWTRRLVREKVKSQLRKRLFYGGSHIHH
ncbi:MAG: FxsA family protein [Candidatus Poribacteria bacterium]|nr:FxsA family protein [Candidatus Poribacteria bacterium]